MQKSKIVIKTSIFPSSQDTIWEKLKKLDTLQYIAYPYATFALLNDCDNFKSKNPVIHWQSGEVYRFSFKLFGIIPFGIHTIEMISFDSEKLEIYTHEYNSQISKWDHLIKLKKIDENHTEYTDEVEIYAGWKTPFVCLWAKLFYSHRQKKWLKLLK